VNTNKLLKDVCIDLGGFDTDFRFNKWRNVAHTDVENKKVYISFETYCAKKKIIRLYIGWYTKFSQWERRWEITFSEIECETEYLANHVMHLIKEWADCDGHGNSYRWTKFARLAWQGKLTKSGNNWILYPTGFQKGKTDFLKLLNKHTDYYDYTN
jgi:hypothetical protein